MEFNVLESYLGKKVEICENMIFFALIRQNRLSETHSLEVWGMPLPFTYFKAQDSLYQGENASLSIYRFILR